MKSTYRYRHLHASKAMTASRSDRNKPKRGLFIHNKFVIAFCLLFVSVAWLPIGHALSTIPTTTEHRRVEAFGDEDVVNLSALEYCCSEDGAKDTQTQKAPVIFLHGLLGNKRNFNSIARSLCTRLKHPRKILGLDLRNHGDNTERSCNMSYTSMAKDVLNFMDSNDIPQAELIGHSVGGKVAQALALLSPERVRGLVVLDIAPVVYTEAEPHWQAVSQILKALSEESTTSLSKREMDTHLRSKGVVDPNVRAFCLANYQEGSGWKIPVDILNSQLNTLAGFDDTLQSRQWSGDAFFVNGGQSKFVRSSHLAAISEFFPKHMLTTIRGAGHWVHAEAPEDTTALLQQYLERDLR